MPPRGTVATEANEIIEGQLRQRLGKIERETKGDVLVFFGRLLFGADGLIRDAIEQIKRKKEKLVVVLETVGGYVEVTQRIADVFRHHYQVVEFIVPNYAMSAGTVLVMSGDAIYMDYYSVLGPIDPQVERPDGKLVPGLGYLIEFDRLVEKSNQGQLSTAELAYFVQNFDPAEMYSYKQARNLAVSLLKEWLVKYKFKNWNVTQGRGTPVSEDMKKARAEEIGNKLNDTERWSSHGRGISMAVLRTDLNLMIEDFGGNANLSTAIREYHTLLRDYMGKRS